MKTIIIVIAEFKLFKKTYGIKMPDIFRNKAKIIKTALININILKIRKKCTLDY